VPLEQTQRAASGTACLDGIGPGQLYGYRVARPISTGAGPSLQPQSALARSVRQGALRPDGLEVAACSATNSVTLIWTWHPNREEAAGAPLGVVIDPSFDWTGETRPNHAFHELIIYEAHVRGLTMQHPEVPETSARDVSRHVSSGRDQLPERSGCHCPSS